MRWRDREWGPPVQRTRREFLLATGAVRCGPTGFTPHKYYSSTNFKKTILYLYSLRLKETQDILYLMNLDMVNIQYEVDFFWTDRVYFKFKQFLFIWEEVLFQNKKKVRADHCEG